MPMRKPAQQDQMAMANAQGTFRPKDEPSPYAPPAPPQKVVPSLTEKTAHVISQSTQTGFTPSGGRP